MFLEFLLQLTDMVSILAHGDYLGHLAEEDSTIVDVLFNIREFIIHK